MDKPLQDNLPLSGIDNKTDWDPTDEVMNDTTNQWGEQINDLNDAVNTINDAFENISQFQIVTQDNHGFVFHAVYCNSSGVWQKALSSDELKVPTHVAIKIDNTKFKAYRCSDISVTDFKDAAGNNISITDVNNAAIQEGVPYYVSETVTGCFTTEVPAKGMGKVALKKCGSFISVLLGYTDFNLINGFQLFQTQLFDHQPNNASWLRADTFSWQSGAVYTSAYAELLAEKNLQANASTDDFFYGLNNATVLGNPTITTDGVLSNLSSRNGIQLPNAFTPASQPWEMEFDFVTGSDVTTSQAIVGEADSVIYKNIVANISASKFYLHLSSNGSSFNLANAQVGSYTVLPNTRYKIRIGWTGTSYYLKYSTDLTNFVSDIAVSSSTAIFATSNKLAIGNHLSSASAQIPFLGKINLKYCKISINGTVWWQPNIAKVAYYRSPKGYKIALADQESNIVALYNALGIAWYYILDTANTRFKLPRTKYFLEGCDADGNVGDTVLSGLPNIKGSFVNSYDSIGVPAGYDKFSGSFTNTQIQYDNNIPISAGQGNGSHLKSFDASRSNGIYGGSNIVQPPATKMYLYFYVGNTVQNQSLIDVGELTTALNNKVDLNCENANVASKTQKGVTQFCGTVPTTVSSASESRPAVIIENYLNGTGWYRKWSDGWIEQGGEVAVNIGTSGTLTFPVPFTNTNYTCTSNCGNNTPTNGFWLNTYNAKATTSIGWLKSHTTTIGNWYACGY